MNTLIGNILYYDFKNLSLDELKVICEHPYFFISEADTNKFSREYKKIISKTPQELQKYSIIKLISEFYNSPRTFDEFKFLDYQDISLPTPIMLLEEALKTLNIDQMFFLLDTLNSPKYKFFPKRTLFYGWVNHILCTESLHLDDDYVVFGVRGKKKLYESLREDWSYLSPSYFIEPILKHIEKEIFPLAITLLTIDKNKFETLPFYLTKACKQHVIQTSKSFYIYLLRTSVLSKEEIDHHYNFGEEEIERRKLGKYSEEEMLKIISDSIN